MKLTYGDTSNAARPNSPCNEASTPSPASGLSAAVPTEYVALGASSPLAKSSCTVGARNERAREKDPVRPAPNWCTAPREAVQALELRESDRFWNTESVE